MDTVANFSFNLPSCARSISGRYIFTAWFSVYLLFLPVFLFVLYICFNKWKKPQSSASGGLSHSDVFTLHMVAMEIACAIGSCVICYGFYIPTINVFSAAGGIFSTTFTGQMLFHSLTCVERYLAVVHPVTYLRLKGEGGVTIRNIAIVFVWAFSVGYSLFLCFLIDVVIYGVLGFVVSFLSLPFVAYCTIYVLCVLIRPKPGERGRDRKQIDQSKRTTVYTMVVILGALLLRLMVYVVNGCVMIWFWWEVDGCVVYSATLWVALPSSLVLPLLFLHRAGKLPTRARKQ